LRTDDYLLGHTPEEYERLRVQARMWEPANERLLDRIALGPGARCLDAGCGPGEAMRLMAERVGHAGEVVGIDADATAGAEAIRGLRAAGHRQCTFEPADVELDDQVPGAPFDLVFARLLLLHVADTRGVLRRLWSWVAPGGHLVVQDHDITTGGTFPRLDSADEFKRVLADTWDRAGIDAHVGVRLPLLYEEAGIGAPDGTDVATFVERLDVAAPRWEAVFRSLLPNAVSLGVTTPQRGEQWFGDFARDVAGDGGHVSLWPLMIGAWKRKPG
jgi:SAM-dependent methyltransferase